jgi:PPIC-type PPIASE domain
MNLFRTALLALIAILCFSGMALPAPTPEILAFVGEDTLTTIDLQIELNLMDKRNERDAKMVLPEPEAALRRMIQNRLIIQEGYRMGLQDGFAVSNQVTEAVDSRCVGALLDSVALAVPKDTDDWYEMRRLAVKNYIENLMKVYNVEVDSTLLRSLDYGSSDPEMKAMLRDNEDVLVVAPTGRLTVSAFSRLIRFTAFHGLEGKQDADERRDKILNEWVAEAVTIHQVRRQDIASRPEIQLYKIRLERTLMLEETLKVLLDVSFQPTAEEIESYYEQHLDRFLKPAQVKMESLKFVTEDAAKAARKRLEQGAKMNWIKRNMDQVIEGPRPFPMEWIEAGKLNLKDEQAKVGYIPEPYGVPGGWVLAIVTHVQNPDPFPLAESREKVLRMMGAESVNNQMLDVISQLEEVIEVRIEPDAVDKVGRVLAELEDEE